MAWIIYGAVVLVISWVVGLHLGKFREAYTEMTGMMAGMTMGMLNGFVLGYAAGAYFNSLFWGNLVGMVLGAAYGIYFGRPGALMGIMDGAMGGIMGGSMGAMLAVMLIFPAYGLLWTAVLLGVVYLAGMLGLVVLIERSAPGHAALHRLAPYFTRAVSAEIEEQAARTPRSGGQVYFDDYYAFLGVERDAPTQAITDAYLEVLSLADEGIAARAERAIGTLSDPVRRTAYDKRLAIAEGRGECCPPTTATATTAATAATAAIATTESVARRKQAVTTASVPTAAAPRRDERSTPSLPARRNGASRRPAPGERTGTAPALGNRGRARARGQTQRESPISWVGGGALLVMAALLLVYWLSRPAADPVSQAAAFDARTDTGLQLPAEMISQLRAQAVPATSGTNGVQSLDLVVNGDRMGYRPRVVKVKKDSPVTFNLSTEGRDPGCGRFVGIQGLGAHGIATPGQVSPMSFTPDRAGIFQINCNMHMMEPGYIIVE